MADRGERPSKEEAAYTRGVRDTGVALVDMVDICDHALAALEGMDAPEAIAGGIAAARDQLVAQFEKIGLESVFPLGERFDPMVHEAVSVESCTGQDKDGFVCRVHRRGWLHEGQVVRAAVVSVFQAVVICDPAPSSQPAPDPDPEPPAAKVRRTPAAPKPAPADSPSARRRRQRDRTGMDSFAFTYQTKDEEQ
jgi:hypothetical protein